MTEERSEPAEQNEFPDRASDDRTPRHGNRPADPSTVGSRYDREGGPPRTERPRVDAGRSSEGPRGGRPYGGKPTGGRPHAGKPQGGRPYGDRPGAGGGYANRSQGGRPYAGRPQGDRSDRPRYDVPRDQRGSAGPRGGRGFDRSAGAGRRVEYGRVDRGGPRPPRGAWDRADRSGARMPAGPPPADVLGENEEIVAGRRPVEEAFAARREVKRMLVVPGRRAALEQLVLHATTLRIPVVEVEGGTITSVAGFDGHQGVALVVAPRQWASLDDVLALAKSRAEPPFVLALDHLEDPQNVGTLLRSAEACGVHGVIFPTQGAAPISPAAIKTSAGAVEHLLLVPMPDLASGLVELHTRGVRVIGADGDAPMTVREVDMRGPIVIVTGSEGRGLHAKVRRRVDLMARIPMRGKVASLNASVAGSVFLFEAAAQRDLPEAERPAPESAMVLEEGAEAQGATSDGVAPDTGSDAAAVAGEALLDRSDAAHSDAGSTDAVSGASEAHDIAIGEAADRPATNPDDLLPEPPR